jgi:acyl-CoA synthetase (NDP forming)
MKTVAVIGASADRRKFGNKAVRAFVRQGYRVVPITPFADEVEGLRAFPSVADVPDEIDMATFYVPPDMGLRLIDGVARKGVREVWFNGPARWASSRSSRAASCRLARAPT